MTPWTSLKVNEVWPRSILKENKGQTWRSGWKIKDYCKLGFLVLINAGCWFTWMLFGTHQWSRTSHFSQYSGKLDSENSFFSSNATKRFLKILSIYHTRIFFKSCTFILLKLSSPWINYVCNARIKSRFEVAIQMLSKRLATISKIFRYHQIQKCCNEKVNYVRALFHEEARAISEIIRLLAFAFWNC